MAAQDEFDSRSFDGKREIGPKTLTVLGALTNNDGVRHNLMRQDQKISIAIASIDASRDVNTWYMMQTSV